MGASRWQIFKDVLIWESLQPSFVGLRSAVSMALVIVIVAEMFIGSDTGLGHRIIDCAAGAQREEHVRVHPRGRRAGLCAQHPVPRRSSAASCTGAEDEPCKTSSSTAPCTPTCRCRAFKPGPAGTHITIRGLTKYFAGWPLYENFDLDIPKHKIVSVFGPNGCGKSTLINMIAGLIPIDSGEILFDGKSLKDTKIGYVFQNYREAMFPWMRTIDNIAYPLKLEGRSKAEVDRRMAELVASFDVKFDLKRYPYELSGGQQQTASIMRALAPKPEVLFLDEPFSALDFEMTLFIREKLQEVFMQTGTTMLLVSHDLEEAVYLADQVLLLTKRPTRVAEILRYGDARPRTVETLSAGELHPAPRSSAWRSSSAKSGAEHRLTDHDTTQISLRRRRAAALALPAEPAHRPGVLRYFALAAGLPR